MKLFNDLEAQHGLPSGLLDAVMKQESGGNTRAVSPKGARGAFQFMPATAKQYGVNVDDLASSAIGAAKMYADLLKQNGGDLNKALAGYNWGQGNVERKGMANLPGETKNYIQKVTANMNPQANDPREELIALRRMAELEDKAVKTTPTAPQVAKQEQPNQPGFGERLNANIKDIPRQLGLTARYLAEGVGQVADIPGVPLAIGLNKLNPFGDDTFKAPSVSIGNALTSIGLPSPQTPLERVVGDASRTLAGGGGIVKGAHLASKIAPAFSALAARPALQAASAVGSGGAGGYVRETGGDTTSQIVAAVAGGLLAPGAVAGAQAAARGISNYASSFRPVPANITVQINNAIEQAGVKAGSLSPPVMAQLERDVAKAMQQGNLSTDALRRLVDYRLVGATPGRGNLTLNPVDITQQKNLSKIGANSSNTKLQGLAMQQNENTGALIRNLNELGADTVDDAFAGGQRVIAGLNKTANARQGKINDAYANARNQTGLDAKIDPSAFTQRAGDLLKENLLEGSLPSDVRRILNDSATGKIPLTVSTSEQIKTTMGNLQRSSADGSTRKAIGLVRQALDDAPLLQGQGEEAIQAFNQARGLNRNWRTLVEKTPALQAIEDGVQPDKFVQQYVIQGGGKANVTDVARLKNAIKDSPEAIQAVRQQILSHLKSRATSGKPDEARLFSQSGFNNSFSAIGERKLQMFFTRAEIDKLKSVGRVALYEQTQPSGSAVNNSNSGALAVAKIFDFLGDSKIINSIPFGNAIVSQPAKSLSASIQGSAITNVSNALIGARPKPPPFAPANLLLAPGASSPDRRN